jgi:hypothetical protein
VRAVRSSEPFGEPDCPNVLARSTAQYRALLGDASAQVMKLVSQDLDLAKLAQSQAAEQLPNKLIPSFCHRYGWTLARGSQRANYSSRKHGDAPRAAVSPFAASTP